MSVALPAFIQTTSSHARLEPVDEPALIRWAQHLAAVLSVGGVIYLEGDLGAGKTTLARALIQALGYQQRVKSPTYSLLEEYPLDGLQVVHLDLYRLADPADVLDLGLEEYGATGPCLLLVEWAQKGRGYLPPADLIVRLELCTLGAGQNGRKVEIEAPSQHGQALLRRCGE